MLFLRFWWSLTFWTIPRWSRKNRLTVLFPRCQYIISAFVIFYFALLDEALQFEDIIRILKMTYFICHFWWDWLRFRLDSFQFCRTVSMWDLRYLKRHVCTGMGVDSGGETWQDHCNYFLWLGAIFCQQLQYSSLVISIYIFTVFLLRKCIYDIIWSCHFLCSIYVLS